MDVSLEFFYEECENSLFKVSSHLEKISSQEQKHPEFTQLLELKKQFLVKIKQLLEKQNEQIPKISTYLEDENLSLHLKKFKEDIDKLNQYFQSRSDLNSQSLQEELAFLRVEYEVLAKDDEKFLELLNLRKKAKNEPHKQFEDDQDRVFQIMRKNFNSLTPKIRDLIFTQEGVYIFTLLYKMSQSNKSYEEILSFGFLDLIYELDLIVNLSPLNFLAVISPFINLRNECFNDETYEEILRFGFSKGILKEESIRQLPFNDLLQAIQQLSH